MTTLHPADTAICKYGLCTVINAITWRRGEIFAYRVRTSVGIRIVPRDDIERAPSAGDLAWAAAKVAAVVESKIDIEWGMP